MVLPLSLMVRGGHAYKLKLFSVVFIKCRVSGREWQRRNICVHRRYSKQPVEIGQEMDCVGEQGDQFRQYIFI
jgi:hypothetical protein